MKKIYIVGIGGAGTSALAIVYAKNGHNVSGVDVGDGFYNAVLMQHGITVFDHFDPAHIDADIDLVIHTTAVSEDNAEICAAKEMGITVQTYPTAVGELTQNMPTIAVCGTHGKTTTTALLAHAMIAANQDITAIVGSQISAWGGGAYVSGKDHLVVEADEYQNKLSHYQPQHVIITSVDYDHPDFFASEATYQKVFVDFVNRVPTEGYIVACGDEEAVCAVTQGVHGHIVRYGTSAQSDCKIIDRVQCGDGQKITVQYNDMQYVITTMLYGMHNAKNVVAAWLMNFLITGDADKGSIGIASFVGTARRLERKDNCNDAICIDDYAHHPAEIRATVTTVRELFPNARIVVAFHPHTFTRTKAFLPDFVSALDIADHVVVLDIYGSARESVGDVTAYHIIDAINQKKSKKAEHVPTVNELAGWMKKNIRSDDVFLTLGAGDIWRVYEKI
jgi:UDP-N-acetylmuramate--alanine ligase